MARRHILALAVLEAEIEEGLRHRLERMPEEVPFVQVEVRHRLQASVWEEHCIALVEQQRVVEAENKFLVMVRQEMGHMPQ
jgi:hypothetical protein